jgi:hypothetical protein
MPRCALPDHLDEKEEIENAFPDDSQYKGFFGNLWKRWNKMTKAWDAWGPRCPQGIAFSMWPPWIMLRKWREVPTIIFAMKGQGPWRLESDGVPSVSMETPGEKFWFFPRLETSAASIMTKFYVSRIQYWTRWHVQIQWPLFICFHWYKDAKDVLPTGSNEDRDGKLIMGYIGAKRDADKVFWYVAAFFGKCFK